MILEKLKELGIEKPQQLSRFFQKHYRTGKMPKGREEYYEELLEATKWLPINSSYTHRWFVLENGLKDYPECCECGEPIIWRPQAPDDIDRDVCGKKCSAIKRQREYVDVYKLAAQKGHKSKDQKVIGKKISEARLSWDDEFKKELTKRVLKTKYDKGIYKTGRYKTDWQHYKSLVIAITRKVDVTQFENSEKRGKCGIDGAYQLDHKISIDEGFKLGLLPYIVGNSENLQMIPWLENSRKKAKPYKEWLEGA